jgi:hypothetical protein
VRSPPLKKPNKPAKYSIHLRNNLQGPEDEADENEDSYVPKFFKTVHHRVFNLVRQMQSKPSSVVLNFKGVW